MLGKTWGTQLQNESPLFLAIVLKLRFFQVLPEQILLFLAIFSLSQFGVLRALLSCSVFSLNLENFPGLRCYSGKAYFLFYPR